MELGLGTAQFGAAYGVSNTRGQIPERDIGPLLQLAASAGFRVLDTAAAYGDGESESVIGRNLWEGHPFRIVTKTSPVTSARIATTELCRVADGLERSLERLRTRSIYGLLVHHARELMRPGGERLAALLCDARNRGVVSRIGFSCYTVAELEAASAVLSPDIVQVPCNVLDRRFMLSGTLAALRKQGTEVHARSLFLQGLLLMPTPALPAAFSAYRTAFERIDEYALRNGVTRLQLALGFATTRAHIDVGLVGVTHVEELHDIVEAARDARAADLDYAGLECADERLVNPARWESQNTSPRAKTAS